MANDPYRAPPSPDSDWHASLAAMDGLDSPTPATRSMSPETRSQHVQDAPETLVTPAPMIGDYMGVSFDNIHPDEQKHQRYTSHALSIAGAGMLGLLSAGIGITFLVIAIGAFNAPSEMIAYDDALPARVDKVTDVSDDYFWQSPTQDYGIYGANDAQSTTQERPLSPALSDIPDRRVISLEEETHDALLDALLGESNANK